MTGWFNYHMFICKLHPIAKQFFGNRLCTLAIIEVRQNGCVLRRLHDLRQRGLRHISGRPSEIELVPFIRTYLFVQKAFALGGKYLQFFGGCKFFEPNEPVLIERSSLLVSYRNILHSHTAQTNRA